MTVLWLIALGIAAIWMLNKVWVHFADEAQEQANKERDWELTLDEEARTMRLKEQALECEFNTVMGELDRIKKLGLD